MKYAMLLLTSITALLLACNNSSTENSSGQKNPAAGTAYNTAAVTGTKAKTAAPKLNPDTLFDINQFRIEMEDADNLWKKFPEKFFAKNGVYTSFDLDKCRLAIHKDSILTGLKRFCPVNLADSTSVGIRIHYGLDGKLALQYYFQVVLLKLDSIKGRSMFFNVSQYDGKYYRFDKKWILAADINVPQADYIRYTWKINDQNDSAKIKVVEGDSFSDPTSITIPWVEIETLIRNNDVATKRYNLYINHYNDSVQTKAFNHVPVIGDLYLQCAPKSNNNTYYHTINLMPYLNKTANGPILYKALTYAAANYTAMCPPNCNSIVYRMR